MLKYRLIVLFVLVIGAAHAQFVESEKEAALRTGSTDNVLPKLILRTNITGLWETLPNVNLAAEYHLFSILSMELEYAHIGPWVKESFIESNDYLNPEGYRLKGALKMYLDVEEGDIDVVYIAPEVYLRSASYSRFRTFGINCSGGCEYYQYSKMNVQERTNGVSFRFGAIFLTKFGANFDLYYSMGYQRLNLTYSNRPQEFSNVYKGSNREFLPPARDALSFRIGCAIGYSLIK